MNQIISHEKTFSLHEISSENNIPFSAAAYSKFKFGDKNVARLFGHALGHSFVKYLKANPIHKRILVCSSPYCFIPTATFAMKNYFVDVLNEYLITIDHSVVEETKIHRTITYRDDYGALSADERMKLIGKDSFHIDVSFLEDKFILFLDDIRITGSHEKVISRMCEQYNITNDRMFLYFAQLTNPDINPNIENYLNYKYVKNLLDLDKIIKNDEFLINTRVVKYVLNSPHDEFVEFIKYQNKTLAKTFYHAAIGNSYHLIPEYRRNFIVLKQYANK